MNTTKRTEISSLGEFGFIERLTKDLATVNKETVKGVGDDAAILQFGADEEVLITTDLFMEGVHFDLTYFPLKHLGYKVVVANISDIYAMNGTPKQITVSLGISRKFCIEDIEELYSGIRLACEQDYDKFYEGEIAIRRELSYPPFCDMVTLTLTSDEERELFKSSKALLDSVVDKLNGEYAGLPFVVFGPFEAQIYKMNEKYRMRMVIKCKLNAKSRSLFHKLLCEFSQNRKTTLAIDFNSLT